MARRSGVDDRKDGMMGGRWIEPYQFVSSDRYWLW